MGEYQQHHFYVFETVRPEGITNMVSWTGPRNLTASNHRLIAIEAVKI